MILATRHVRRLPASFPSCHAAFLLFLCFALLCGVCDAESNGTRLDRQWGNAAYDGPYGGAPFYVTRSIQVTFPDPFVLTPRIVLTVDGNDAEALPPSPGTCNVAEGARADCGVEGTTQSACENKGCWYALDFERLFSIPSERWRRGERAYEEPIQPDTAAYQLLVP